MERITSAQNPKIKMLLELQAKSKARKQSGLFVVEGVREIEHCVCCGYEIHTLFVCPEICGTSAVEDLAQSPQIIEVSQQIYDKLAYRGGTEGMIAEVRAKAHSLEQLKLKENPVVMVLESVEKPGNLGAVLRSADAAGADAVIICDPLTDLYNPNLIRASIGAIFTVPVAACSSEEAIRFLKDRNFKILTAQLQDSHLYYDTDMTGPTAIVMGTESTGLSDLWRKAASAHIRIPMLGRLDSLNVSVSAAILLFEAIRQRQ
ncbi:MAG: RNA methyltransferase [Bacteroidales bacterium]|nr:RNA methyltransferase [Bacteroidales bacterium]